MRIRALSTAIILILSSYTAKSVALTKQLDTLTILHVNDTHSFLLPCGSKDITGKGKIGGIARVATLIKDIKATEKTVLFLHAGDLFVGDLMFNKYFGVAEFEILKSLGCNAMVLGNHEFDLSPSVLESSLAAARLPDSNFCILSANLDLSGRPSLAQFVSPYVIKEIGEIKVGIFGLTTEATNLISFPSPVVVDTALYAAQAWVDTLKNHECNLIILLSHLGTVYDNSIAATVSGIDLIVGGHSHTTIFQPIKVVTPTGDTTLIVQAASHYAYLGNLKLIVGNDGIQSWTYELIRIDDTVTEDPVIASMVQTYVDDLQADPRYGNVYTDVIAQAAVHMTNAIGIGPYKDTPIGNMISDAFRSKTGTDIAFEPQGLTSSNFFAGDLVGADIFQLVPYGYDSLSGLGFKLVTFDIRGLFLITMLESSLLYWPDLKESLLHTSGMSYSFNSFNTPGTRINLSSIRIGGNPIGILSTYSVTVTEGFMAALDRASDVIEIPIANVETTEYFEYNVVRDFICANSPIEYYVEGRIVDLGAPIIPPAIPILILPEDLTAINDSTPEFVWSSTAGDGGYYTLEYALDSLFTKELVIVTDLPNTTFVPQYALSDTIYYWRVEAVNQDGNHSNYQVHPFMFTLDTHPPIFFETTAWVDTNYRGPYMVSSIVTDSLAGIDSVSLYYRFDAENWCSISMNFQNGYYVGEIPELNNISTKIDYYLVARDLATNVATEPAGVPDTFFSFMYYVGIAEKTNEPIPTLYLCESYPNPFATNTLISYQLPMESKISLKIYNFAGQLVRTLIDGKIAEEGHHSSTWDATSDRGQKVVPGIYFCRLEANEFKITNKLILLH